MFMPIARLPRLPSLLDRKIYKTGQTRGADDDEIYQNRVGRNSTVLIPYMARGRPAIFPSEKEFENGYIVLIPPSEYFNQQNPDAFLKGKGLFLGKNALIFYEKREDWNKNNPESINWQPAKSRRSPLGGSYVARIPATTAHTNGGKIIRGFDTTSNKGAGIRVYEYSSSIITKQCRDQLEVLYWLCRDYESASLSSGMTINDIQTRRAAILKSCDEQGLLDYDKLYLARTINKNKNTVCPLCLEELSGKGFVTRMQQAEGREVNDLTVTEVNLFHIRELIVGAYNHVPYNLGWGHHHCNVVTKDAGIMNTLNWMVTIINRNILAGYLEEVKSGK